LDWVLTYFGSLANGAKSSAAGGVQSKSGPLSEKMITFDYIVFVHVMK
jgi:hypothetical protein